LPLPAVASPAPWLNPDQRYDEYFPIEDDDAYATDQFRIPVPSRHLRGTVDDPELGSWLYVGAALAMISARYLPPGGLILDLGCGVGRAALLLAVNPMTRYIGFDIFKPAITWAQTRITPFTNGRFQFAHFDGVSAMYNPSGAIKPSEYEFPCENGSVDVAIAASLFTHLYPEDQLAYLRQAGRVLKPGGRAIFTWQFTTSYPNYFPDDPSPVGQPFYGNEQMAFTDRAFLVGMIEDAGLVVDDDLGKFNGQDCLVLRKEG
jgi:SAM-dependent methyltransferase